MKQKKSIMGIAAGIVLCVLFLYNAASVITIAIKYPSRYFDLFWRTGRIADGCVSVFLIISLFRNRRSWLLLAAHIISVIILLHQMADISQKGYKLLFLVMLLSMILRTIMVAYFCVPSLQKKAGWTGKIWFLPPVLSGAMEIVRILYYQKEYWKNNTYHPLLLGFQLSINLLGIVCGFMFCLWLTEPVRIKKKISDTDTNLLKE